jgi:hypothetical protein
MAKWKNSLFVPLHFLPLSFHPAKTMLKTSLDCPRMVLWRPIIQIWMNGSFMINAPHVPLTSLSCDFSTGLLESQMMIKVFKRPFQICGNSLKARRFLPPLYLVLWANTQSETRKNHLHQFYLLPHPLIHTFPNPPLSSQNNLILLLHRRLLILHHHHQIPHQLLAHHISLPPTSLHQFVAHVPIVNGHSSMSRTWLLGLRGLRRARSIQLLNASPRHSSANG